MWCDVKEFALHNGKWTESCGVKETAMQLMINES